MIPGLLLLAAAQAACPELTFDFDGQPDCVSLAYEDGRITVDNACTQPLLIDASLHTTATLSPIIAPGATAEIRDLSFFTVGMGGELYEVIAGIVPTPPCEAPSEDDTRMASAKR